MHSSRNNQDTFTACQPQVTNLCFFRLHTVYSSLFSKKNPSVQPWLFPSSVYIWRPLFSHLFLVIKSAGINAQLIKPQYPHHKCRSLALSSLTREWAGKAKSLSQAFKMFLIPFSSPSPVKSWSERRLVQMDENIFSTSAFAVSIHC